MIKISNLTYAYENHVQAALQSIDLEIGEGEYIALIGPNGCGKTTLIRHLNALLLPTGGSVEIDGLNTRSKKQASEIRRRVGMVFQNPDNQIVGMSVEEDVAFGPGNLGLPPIDLRSRVSRSLAEVGLAGFEKRLPYSLSGGEKQLLAIAGLLAMDPKYIVLDEPTSSLDPAGKKMVLELLNRLVVEGISIINVTHDMDEAALADRILVMNNGRLVADGVPDDILSRIEWLKALGLAPPRVAELMWHLQQRGIDLKIGMYSVDAAVDLLFEIINRA